MQVAHTLHNLLARQGRTDYYRLYPGFSPGSEIANLSVLGYDLPSCTRVGCVEAASMGVEVLPGELCLRCNLVNLRVIG